VANRVPFSSENELSPFRSAKPIVKRSRANPQTLGSFADCQEFGGHAGVRLGRLSTTIGGSLRIHDRMALAPRDFR